MGYPADCLEEVGAGEGLIKIYNNNGYVQLAVIANTDEDIRKTARVLANYKDYNLEGSEVKVGGTVDNPTTNIGRGCTDSDGGQDYYIMGTITWGDVVTDDLCDGDELTEFVCDSDSRGPIDYQFNCPFGCENGACLRFYEENEDIAVYEEEDVQSSIDCAGRQCFEKSEQCVGNDKIIIQECVVYISQNGQCEKIVTSNSKKIKNACVGEVVLPVTICQGCGIDQTTCIPFGTRLEKEGKGYYCNIDTTLDLQKEDKVGCQNSYECLSNNCKGSLCKPVCEGCLNDNHVCVPYGTRAEGKYCELDYQFKNQKSEDRLCNNNYECFTNLCVDSRCLSPGFIRRILDWFRGLFGG